MILLKILYLFKIMKILCQNQQVHLTYSMNVHPGETAEEVIQNILGYVIPVKKILSPHQAFGIGLRLSFQAAREFETQDKIQKLQALCQEYDLYVFTINGFIYDNFHKGSVKETVYSPDWRDTRRLDYTSILARLLCKLIPENSPGSISTVPVGWKENFRSQDDMQKAVCLLLEQAAYLDRLYQETGKIISLALEPEPGCILETASQTADFFQKELLSQKSMDHLKKISGISSCQEIVRRHLGICYDTCHIAIFHEKPSEALSLLQKAGVFVSKIQISSALKMQFYAKDNKVQHVLSPFIESRYLHQVIEKQGESLAFFPDLPLALQSLQKRLDNPLLEWRIHFHVPIFLQNLGDIKTTQEHILELLPLCKKSPVCHHFEVETYTWEVLPDRFRESDMVNAIAKELQWAKEKIL